MPHYTRTAVRRATSLPLQKPHSVPGFSSALPWSFYLLVSSFPSHILPFPGRKKKKKKKITTNIIHRLQQQSSSYTKKTGVESRRVNPKSHLSGLARDRIKGYGILSSLSLHAFCQVHKMCFLQTAFLGLFPSHTNFPKVSFLFYAEMGIKRIKQMSPFLNSVHLHHIHT